jgi:molecular chaperone GrpE
VSEEYPQERVVVNDRRRIDPLTGEVRPGVGSPPAPGGPAGQPASAPSELVGEPAEVEALSGRLAERTADLQRVTAEYANYRKRVDRDRQAVVDIATGTVLAALLPVLDDIDRARQHGDLNGAFKSVADSLEATLEKIGLQSVGAVGEPFDPTVHEAVAHQVSPDVTEPTCVAVLRRGYRQGERLLRAPLVAVAEPAGEPGTPIAAGAEDAELLRDAELLGDDELLGDAELLGDDELLGDAEPLGDDEHPGDK